MQAREKFQIDKYDLQTLLGLIRLFICGLGLVVSIGVIGSTHFDGVNPVEIAAQYKSSIWIFEHVPMFIMVIIAAIFNGNSLRFMVPPTLAIMVVLVSGAYYVQDVYALPDFKSAFKYVISSMFAVNYPELVIDKGSKQIAKHTVNLIDKIGGPGFVTIEPGNAATFQTLHGPSNARVSTTYFLAPFENIAQTINLDEQQGDKERATAVTRDGLRVVLSDIHFRYRILQQSMGNGAPVRRSLQNPYPFSEDAIRNMTFNLMVQKNGLEKWKDAVERSVTAAITDFVSSHDIDYLTAPRSSQFNPHLELRNQLFVDAIRTRLAALGAELLWVDVGHVEIEDEAVDEERATLWAVDWAGDASEKRAYGDAIRQAYQELGRAEAQADLILSVAGALSSTDLTKNSRENIRKILLARTAQILEAMSKNHRNVE